MKNLKIEIEIEKTISVCLFEKMIQNTESKFNNKSLLFKDVKYNKDDLNKSLNENFSQIKYVLQSIVDKFYVDSFLVDSFVYFSLEDFDFCLSHNISVLNSCKKLIRFIN